VKSGRMRVLAVTGANPSKLNPEWPTLQSQGVKDVDASNWTLLLAPRGTPQAVVEKLQAEVVKILNMADVKERFAGGGVETIPTTSAALDAKVKQTAAQLSVIVEKAKIKPD
jgi:tripartite-type tricarboxylate transporter receptor subunit TctC